MNLPIPMKVVHLLSGGIDSTVLLYDLIHQGCRVHPVLCYYGQRHFKELASARSTCNRLNLAFTEIDLPHVFQGSALTADDSDNVVVPNRNMTLISFALVIACRSKSEAVTIGCNADDAAVFPDCTKDFINALFEASLAAKLHVDICAPYFDMTKREIVERGRKLHVPLHETWSCYVGGEKPCGTCLACTTRTAALL